jgi:glycosyltransferase involved in cell wall biosynthesis
VSTRLPQTIVHYSSFDPRTTRGGVETFGRNLQQVFERVLYMTPTSRDIDLVVREHLPVVCDNHMVLDWPDSVPVIGFQHGVAAKKLLVTKSRHDALTAWRQWRAAKRPRTLWVANSQWVSETFGKLSGNRATHVIYNPADLERFDGRLDNSGSRMVLHDARSPHKGSELMPILAKALPAWRFQPLDCPTAEVPAMMRRAFAFLHLSRYEGNSVVCNEAMAMNLPCLFTRVGLMLDRTVTLDVQVIPVRAAFGRKQRLIDEVGRFLERATRTRFAPRAFCEKYASADVNRSAWRRVLADFRQL